MDPRQVVEQRADIVVNDLNQNGGLLPRATANKFISEIYSATPLFSAAHQERMPSPSWSIPRVGFTGQILMNDPGAGNALADGDRKKVTTFNVQLDAKLYRGEVWLPYDVLEDNIEGQTFQTTVMNHIAKQVGLDLANCFLNGDTALAGNGTDEGRLLGVQDGVLKKFAANVFDAGGSHIDDDVFGSWYKTLPQKYRDAMGPRLKFYVNDGVALDWRAKVSKRMTGKGDEALTEEEIPRFGGKGIVGDVGLKPDVNTGFTKGMLTDPANLIIGIWREITIEAWKDIRRQVIVTVVSVRAAFAAYQPGGLVIASGLLPKA